jgi:threonylcarbamoyladenosine tRNA methylthiotransferase MtaB
MKYAVLTFGCRVNQADSFDLEASLRTAGGVASPADRADLVIVNTCTVTGAADQAARNLIRRVASRNTTARIIVTGCYATREPAALASLPGVARVVPNAAKRALWEDLLGGRANAGAAARGGDDNGSTCGDGALAAQVGPGAMGRTAHPLRVQTGCEEPCAFCIVPSTRGASRSRPIGDVLAEVGQLAAAGYKELWLVGVHLGAYGRDLPRRVSLFDLARALDGAPGDVTFRISSLEPMDCSPPLVDLVARSCRFAPHFHLPLQHASDRMLGLMRRPYAFAAFRDLVAGIHARLPHASIGTDLIVGFPGESEEEALEAERLVAALPLSYLHVFPYSDRPGTAAAAMTPKVATADVKRRALRMRELGARLAARFARSNTETTRPGLTLDDGTIVLTDNFLKVAVPAGHARNVRVRVRIDSCESRLAGHVV